MSTKLWVGNEMFIVEDEVYDYTEELVKKIEQLKEEIKDYEKSVALLVVEYDKAMSFKDDSILANLDVAMEKIIEVHNKYWQEKQVKK